MADKDSLTEAFLACRSLLARLVARMVPPQDIEDIVQETYVRVCRFKPRDEIRNPQALMVTTAGNLARDHIRHAAFSRVHGFDDLSDVEMDRALAGVDSSSVQAASDQEFAQFCAVVRELPQQRRRVFVLKKVYGYSQKEIATELSISESTVEKHIARAMEHCAARMWHYFEHDSKCHGATERALLKRGERR